MSLNYQKPYNVGGSGARYYNGERFNLDVAFAGYPLAQEKLRLKFKNILDITREIYLSMNSPEHRMLGESMSSLCASLERQILDIYEEGLAPADERVKVAVSLYEDEQKKANNLTEENEKLKADVKMLSKGTKLNEIGVRRWREAAEAEMKDLRESKDSEIRQLKSEYEEQIKSLNNEVKELEERKDLYWKWYKELKAKQGIKEKTGFWDSKELIISSDLEDFIKNIKVCFEKFHRLPMSLPKTEYEWLPKIKPFNNVIDFLLNSDEIKGELYLYIYFFFANKVDTDDKKLVDELFNSAIKMNPLFEIYFNFLSGDYYTVSSLRKKYKQSELNYDVPLPGFNYGKLLDKIESNKEDPKRYLNWIKRLFEPYKDREPSLFSAESWCEYLSKYYIKKYIELGKLKDTQDEKYEESDMLWYNKSLYNKIKQLKENENV